MLNIASKLGGRWARTTARLGVGLWRQMLAHPVAAILAFAQILIAALTSTLSTNGELGQALAAGIEPTITNGRWWTPLTSLFVTPDPVQFAFSLLGTVLFVGTAESLLGARRTALWFLLTGSLGVLSGLALQRLGSEFGIIWAEIAEYDLSLDPLTGVVGVLLLSSAFMRPLWRRRIRVITLTMVILFVAYVGDTTDFYRLLSATLGLGIGEALTRRARGRRARRWLRSSHKEARTLWGAVSAVSALGPVVVTAAPDATGVLFVSGISVVDRIRSAESAIGQCASRVTEECDRLVAISHLFGPGASVMLYTPYAVLIVAAWGLRKGRRSALWVTAIVNVGLISSGIFLAVRTLPLVSRDEIVIGVMVLSSPLIAHGVLTAALIHNRRRFNVRTSFHAVRQFWATVTASFAAMLSTELVAGWMTRSAFLPGQIDFLSLVSDVPRRFIPGIFLGSIGSPYYATNQVTIVIFNWVGPVFWASFTLALLRLFLTSDASSMADNRQQLSQLLRQGGGGTMGFMATWPGNDYWIAADGRSAVAYRVINGIAITMSDPIAPGSDGRATIRGFAEFCDTNSWVPVFYSVHEQYLPVFDELDWQVLSVGEETLMHPPTFELTGKPWQKVRQALNRGIKEGLTTLWTTWDELPLAMVNEITSISEQWVAEKELPEMGFTLGAMEELKDPEVALMLAIGPDGRLQAITSWLPSYRDGKLVGWTIDFMRRADGSINGVMEFLIASAAIHMRETGVEVLSLSGAPLATKPLQPGEDPPAATTMSRLMDFLAKTLEPAYGFSSLFRFKAKFNPTYETIYMTYPDPLALPAIGMAVGKAYLPTATTRDALALLRNLSD